MALTTINSSGIKDDSLVNADIKSDAAIALSKLASTPALLTGSTNNTITTVTGANAIQGEANLVFNGTSLGIGTNSPTAFDPSVHLKGGDPCLLLEDSATVVDYFGINVTSGAVTTWFDDAAFFRIGTAAGHTGANFAEKLHIDSSGNVGINCTPSRELHVKGLDVALRLESTAATGRIGVEFYDTSAQKGFFGYPSSSNDNLAIQQNEAADLYFYVNGADRLHIASSGNVGIGITSPTTKIHSVQSDASVGNNLILDNNYSSGGTTTFLKAYRVGGAVGYALQYKDSPIKIRQGTYTDHSMEFFTNDTARLTLETSGNVTVNDGDLVIGTAGHGIDFSANSHASGMSSELLDSYEEGTFTPTAGVGSFTTEIATYTKIGRLVTFQIYGTFGSSSSGTGEYMQGFPFTGLSSTYYSVVIHSDTTSSTGPMGQFEATSGKLYFKDSSNNGFNGGDMSGHFVNIAGFYYSS